MEDYKFPANDKKIAVAVSGGADSLALTMLANNWAKINKINLLTFTINHGLRPESLKESSLVEKQMKKLSIKHETIVWEGNKPKSGIQIKARNARYRLLAEACIKHDVRYILLGHHKDDQIETFIIRLINNSGLDGLTCMSENNCLLTESGPINILRPLLDISKKHLVQLCIDQKISWLSDPSNEDHSFMRTRVRSLIDNQIANDFYKTISIYKKLKLSFSKYIDRFMQESIKYNKDGICKFSRDKFIQSPFILQERFLKKVFCTIGGKTYPPKSKIINRIIKNISSENFSNITAGKVFFNIDKKLITVLRQPEASIKCTPLTKKIVLWDKRFIIKNRSKKPSISVGPLGEKDYLMMLKLKKIKKFDDHYYAVKSLPAIRSLDEIVYVPHLSYSKEKYWEQNITVKYLYDKRLKLVET